MAFEPVPDWPSSHQPDPARGQYAAAFLLAGGQSSRMGTNKALLPFRGEPLVALQLRKLREVSPDAAIAGGVPELAAHGRLIPDLYPGEGPLGGIVSALEQTPHEWNLFLAVDMPLLPVSALRMLLFSAGRALVTMAHADGRVQPLCGVYSRRALPVLRAELQQGNRRVRAAAEATGPVSYWQARQPSWFTNVNTPEELAAAGNFTDPLDT